VSQDGSNHPRFAEEDLLAIPIPDAVLSVQKKIDALVKEAIEARRESARLLDEAKKTVEDMMRALRPEGEVDAYVRSRHIVDSLSRSFLFTF